MIKVVKAVLRLVEARLRASGLKGPNSRERVREKIVVVLNGHEIKQ
jgi:hypothetical protein